MKLKLHSVQNKHKHGVKHSLCYIYQFSTMGDQTHTHTHKKRKKHNQISEVKKNKIYQSNSEYSLRSTVNCNDWRNMQTIFESYLWYSKINAVSLTDLVTPLDNFEVRSLEIPKVFGWTGEGVEGKGVGVHISPYLNFFTWQGNFVKIYRDKYKMQVWHKR